MIDDELFYQIAGTVMADETELAVVIDIKSAWFMIAGLQLATRHPLMTSQQKKELEGITRQFQARIVELHPEAAELLEMGWDTRNDRIRRGIELSRRRRDSKKPGETLTGH